MALSAKHLNPPEKVINDVKKSKPIKPATSIEQSLTTSSRNPFIKGTFPNSILVHISIVTDQKMFFEEFMTHFQNGDNVWGLEAKLYTEGKRCFAEFLMAKVAADSIIESGFKLPSFEHTFMGFYSLSSDSKIIKVSISGLPFQYGRSSGGTDELRADLQKNMSKFGKIVDCGITRVPQSTSKHDNNTAIRHEVRWQYSHLSFDSDPVFVDSQDRDTKEAVTIYATWVNVKPYCRYCHKQDHVIIDWTYCQELPKKNSTPTISNSKRRKVNQPIQEEESSREVEVNDLVNKEQIPIQDEGSEEQVEKTTDKQWAEESGHIENSKVDSTTTVQQKDQVCKHCQLPGHVRTTSKKCLINLSHPDHESFLLSLQRQQQAVNNQDEDDSMREISDTEEIIMEDANPGSETESL
ncbi:uncharacterized protein EV154DRAFT_486690 [Mucor mucedo]|uniref:uncharacterized protein n=1 Tax=Mucor mucedo TaxID=29922 RepID=UPI00221FB81A|nr:uncharacterized protein EV154DRAFT_486690 [Mucor mucedo]KAI7875644.1 hypothetical protein EV154DRAFT_486690 [Mucor mucedo]